MDGIDFADMCVRNLLPRPSPVLAPLTRPAMSTNSKTAGTIFCDLEIVESVSSRSSGHGDDALIGLDGAKGIICRLRLARACDGVEERALSDVGETDDSGA